MDIQKIGINEPCNADWEAMTGSSSCKFCDACEKSVHNLSAMTEREATALVATESDLCVRYQRDAVGQIRFQAEGTRRSRWARRIARSTLGAAMITAVAACGTGNEAGFLSRAVTSIGEAVGLAASGCSLDAEPEMGEMVEEPLMGAVVEHEFEMGDVQVVEDVVKPAPMMGRFRSDH